MTGIDRTLFTRDKLFIGGEWVEPSTEARIDIVNPCTEEIIGSVPEAGMADADRAIAAATDAFAASPWRGLTYVERAEYLERLAQELEKRAEDIATVHINDFGGLVGPGRMLAARGAAIVRSYVQFAQQLPPGVERRRVGDVEALVVHEPVGPVLGIVPWNTTFAITLVKLAPALLAGCPVVIKIAFESPMNSFLIADAIEAAGIPKGLVSFLPADRPPLEGITSRPEFRHISFTGSTAAGIGIMKDAAENVTDVTLELGGKSPGIVLDDLDPAKDAHVVFAGTMSQAGQVCTTYSRLFVPRAMEQEWRTALTEFYSSLVIGDPSDRATQVGPLVSAGHRSKVENYIRIARDEGATILTGGGRPESMPHGYFVEPTLVADVHPDMRIVREEVFGPVITLQAYDTIDEAIVMANDTEYGLAAGIFTRDEERGLSIAGRIEAGTITLNMGGACLLVPFGGYKKSGLGREGGLESVLALLEIKQIQVGQV
ncbi:MULTISPECIES: aldehyde dehydrogenase family protein [Actinomadura]|uniref:Acyl-CoA reductase n=1 Tax=Actinomadura madurae TaxID=1993 RepID=A0A1I5NGL7_9ACTN|nr:aldehyde dehydrogenase family protein [Actinomadura madurae]SFP20842.1 Acyl-CoA reductase [Actinomadura madurae]